MNNFLKHYRLKIHTLSPVAVGSGEKIGKKEYIYLPAKKRALVPDIEKMYADLCRKGLGESYLRYMLDKNARDLGKWLKEQGFSENDYKKWSRYELDARDAMFEAQGKSGSPREILAFIKDAYGMPYVPGSTLKGMIRTALLAWECGTNERRYGQIRQEIYNTVRTTGAGMVRRDKFLGAETQKLETIAFHTLKREGTADRDAVNCNLSGLIVSDSEPLNKDSMMLAQKVDYTMKREEKVLPIFREALIPGTDIYFDISLDSSECPYSIEDIFKALNYFQEICQKHFYSKFRRGEQRENCVWLGSWCGFLSKTVIYSLFEEDGLMITDKIFRNTLAKNYQIHKHNQDTRLGVSPHICKCTRYHGKLYDMGLGQIEVVK